ncbi:outer membrane beta-barrel protein [Paraglaciecola aquimarina]|uniref:Outer membrane beta-barrel protein n=1 Tax=Paraglaciecola algarum TaxID=3050085 RepID=A0ABS9DAX7_9ALTE|nr:outer membrane beta-barrel protein [Paraglaciecola sp. G1-23]MCF2949879.1 outer membrane beta-barrel protein [Paraglaciecola sp. G1-23]
MKKTLLTTAIISGLWVNAVTAQEAGFLAEINSRLTYDDNILRTSKAFEQSDTSLVVTPKLELAGILGKQRFAVTYNGEYANYFDNSDVNYADHEFRIGANFDHSNRLTSAFSVLYRDEHQSLSQSNAISNTFTEFSRLSEKQINGQVAYGRQDSFGQLVLKLGHSELEFDEIEDAFRNYDRDLVSLAFYYRIAPRTRLLTQVEYQDYSYSPGAGFIDLDNEYIRYLVGVEWALTNQLDGTIKVGYQDRDYKLAGLQDSDGLSYEADLVWQPNTYTAVSLAANRMSTESDIANTGAVLRTGYALSLTHELTKLTKLDAAVRYSKDDLSFNSTRQDKRHFVKLGVLHDLLTWVELGANISYEDRKSNVALAEYKVNSVNLTAKISFD